MISRVLRNATIGAFAFAAAQMAAAGPVSPLVQHGVNRAQDVSAEQVFRCDTTQAAGSQCARLAKGTAINLTPSATNFDVFAGALSFDTFNVTNLTANGLQLSGLFVAKIDSVIDRDGSFTVTPGDVVVETAVSDAIFAELTGGFDRTSLSLTTGATTDVIAVVFQSAPAVLASSILAGPYATAVADAQLGTVAAALGLVDATDFFDATIDDLRAGIVGGGTIPEDEDLFTLRFGLTVQQYSFANSQIVAKGRTINRFVGDPASNVAVDVSGTGNHTRPSAQSASESEYDIANNITAFFVAQTPEPGTLSLLGFGLIGAGVVARRRGRNTRRA